MFALLQRLSRPLAAGGEWAVSPEPGRTVRLRRRATHAAIASLAAGMAACNIHPLPDDVSLTHLPTEDIVKSARCEMRLGLLEQMAKALRDKNIPFTPYDLAARKGRDDLRIRLNRAHKAKKKTGEHELVEKFDKYSDVAVAYDFHFDITEHNSAEAGLAFKLPLTGSVLDLNAGASGNLTRVGQRSFKAQEKLLALLDRGDDMCKGFKERDKSFAYPITGSIGLHKVVETFIAVSDQGGGKDSFVDTLTFTTTVRGALASSIKIDPVPNSFRLTSATAAVGADRTDIHKVVVSLAFPEEKKITTGFAEQCDLGVNEAICKAIKNRLKMKPRKDELEVLEDVCKIMAFKTHRWCNELKAREYILNPVWRARYNICVADGKLREDNIKQLRLAPPETYCLAYADAFVPRCADPAKDPRTCGPAAFRN
jgi:hypothetical protein